MNNQIKSKMKEVDQNKERLKSLIKLKFASDKKM